MPRNPLPHETHSGERDLILVRTTRAKSGSAIMLLPGTETALTVVSGKENLESYLREELAAGPCRFWIAMLGDIPEASFREIKVSVSLPEIKLS